MLHIAFSFYRTKTAKMVTSISLAKIIFVFAPRNCCDFVIVSLSREVETLSAKTAAKTEDLLCFFDLFESFSSIMSPGNALGFVNCFAFGCYICDFKGFVREGCFNIAVNRYDFGGAASEHSISIVRLAENSRTRSRSYVERKMTICTKIVCLLNAL